jgi:hypothetical protein
MRALINLANLSAAALFFTCHAASAMFLAGVDLPEKASVAGQERELLLNGAGVRSIGSDGVYVIGLYITTKTSTADSILASDTPKRIQIVMLQGAAAQQLADGLISSLLKNNTQEQIARVQGSIDSFRTVLLQLQRAPTVTKFFIDYTPRDGTRLFFNDVQQGSLLPGFEFYQAVLRIWVGDNPTQPSLKEELLGRTYSFGPTL